MLVYGDQQECLRVGAAMSGLTDLLGRAREADGLERHTLSVSLLIEAGRLQQGLEDADEACPDLSRFVLAVGHAVVRSWDTGFAAQDLPALPTVRSSDVTVELRVPEGYAFYALYPERYATAARALRLLAPPRVIGIRSIGTSLSAIVAAALNAPPPVSVRPSGDPFARELTLSDDEARALLREAAHYVIVDEGPGQSGSSFGAVADWLQAKRVGADRIAFLPSHAGPLGPEASDPHRRRWEQAQRRSADFGDELPGFLAGLLNLEAPLREITGGGWRAFAACAEAPIHPMWERRKFLGETPDGRILVKFAGLGRIGERKFAMARALHAAGFVPEPLALVHGFLVERWCGDCTCLDAGERPLQEIAAYIAARDRLFPAASDSGASAAMLLRMMQRNVGLALGAEAAEALTPWAGRLGRLEGLIRRVRTDNKLDRHEWLRSASARLLKTDGLDHHAAHDLIGCQDVAWDVAGAIAEFELDAAEERNLVQAAEAALGRAIDPELLAFCGGAYAAFRLGQASMAASAMGPQTADGAKTSALGERYGRLIHEHLQLLPSPTRQIGPIN